MDAKSLRNLERQFTKNPKLAYDNDLSLKQTGLLDISLARDI